MCFLFRYREKRRVRRRRRVHTLPTVARVVRCAFVSSFRI
jgi:hypothetical protein